jgi:hypothetical protein
MSAFFRESAVKAMKNDHSDGTAAAGEYQNTVQRPPTLPEEKGIVLCGGIERQGPDESVVPPADSWRRAFHLSAKTSATTKL